MYQAVHILWVFIIEEREKNGHYFDGCIVDLLESTDDHTVVECPYSGLAVYLNLDPRNWGVHGSKVARNRRVTRH